MSFFTFNPSIPNSGANPSNQYTTIQTNFLATQQFLAIDHITFNADQGGTHQQTSFGEFSSGTVPSGKGAPTPSVAYPAAGVADPTTAQYYFANPNAIFPVSAIKAFGVFTVAGGTITMTNYFNVNPVVSNPGSTFVVSLSSIPPTPSSTIVKGNDIIVMLNNSTTSSQPTWTFTNPNLTIMGVNGQSGASISFLIIQI